MAGTQKGAFFLVLDLDLNVADALYTALVVPKRCKQLARGKNANVRLAEGEARPFVKLAAGLCLCGLFCL